MNERKGMPSVGPSIDRRCNSRFNTLHDDVKDVGPTALICFCCARVMPYMPKVCKTGRPIDYVQLFSSKRLFGLQEKDVREIFSVETYSEKYLYKDVSDASIRNVRHGFLNDWTLCVDDIEVLCCTEDMKCTRCVPPYDDPCDLCRVPMCSDCMPEVKRKHMPGITHYFCCFCEISLSYCENM